MLDMFELMKRKNYLDDLNNFYNEKNTQEVRFVVSKVKSLRIGA